MLPEPVLPEPVLPVLGIDPEEEPGALGDVVVVPEDVPPVPPAAAPDPCCFRQSSRCVPMRPTHWLGLVEAPVAADPAAEPLVLVSLGRVELEPTLEPDDVPLDDVSPAAAPVDGVVDDAPVEPEAPVPVASVAVDSARSAAAVAAVMVFNIMG